MKLVLSKADLMCSIADLVTTFILTYPPTNLPTNPCHPDGQQIRNPSYADHGGQDLLQLVLSKADLGFMISELLEFLDAFLSSRTDHCQYSRPVRD